MTSPTAVIRSEMVSVSPVASARNRLPFVCTRPPKVNVSPAWNARSVSENTPNWKTGTAIVCSVRFMRTSAPPASDRAVTTML